MAARMIPLLALGHEMPTVGRQVSRGTSDRTVRLIGLDERIPEIALSIDFRQSYVLF